MVSSVGLMAQSESAGVEAVQGFLAELQELSEASGGRVVNWLVDGLIVEFPAPLEAVRLARQLQATLHASRCTIARVALHATDVLRGAETSYGQGMGLVRALTQLANSGDILLTEPVYEAVIEDGPIWESALSATPSIPSGYGVNQGPPLIELSPPN